MLLKSFKNNFYSLIAFVLAISLVVFGGGFIISLISPVFAFPGSANVWNIERMSGSNLLNFYYNSSGSTILQLDPSGSGKAGIRSIVDLDNPTLYSLDPNGTSKLLNLNLTTNGSLITMPDVQNTSYAGFASNGQPLLSDGVPYYWGIGREPGAWVSPFPDLVISNHTGVRLAAHGNYGGVSIYDQLNPGATAWSSAGTEIARFRANGWGGASYITNTNLGIGTTTPAWNLDVTGPANTNVVSRVHATGTGTGYFLFGNSTAGVGEWMGDNAGNVQLNHNSGASGVFQSIRSGAVANTLVLKTSNVGIGTAAPNGKLDIYNSGANGDGVVMAPDITLDNTFTIQTYIDALVGGGWANRGAYAGRCCNNLALQPDVGTVSIGKGQGGLSGNYGFTKLNVFSEDNTEGTNIATFKANNETAGVGIGFYNVRQTGAGQPIYLNAGTSGMVHVGNVSSGGVSLAIGGGNVGVGTTTPQGKFAVGLGNGDQLITYQPADDQLALQTTLNSQPNNGYGGDANILALQPVAGRVGIGTSAPSQKLHVAGNILATGTITASFPAVPANTICRDSAGLLGSCSSDRRLKDSIKPITVSGLDIISKLKPSTFDYKSGLKNQSGFIAQDVLEVLPQAVTTSSDGYYGLNDNIFTPYLVKAIQELNQDNTLLKQSLESQQQQIELLKQEIELLKNK